MTKGVKLTSGGVSKTLSGWAKTIGIKVGCLCERLRRGWSLDDVLTTSVRVENGRTYLPEYKIWGHMKSRCCNPKNKNYSVYGGVGIKVCDRWSEFENFFVDMGTRPTDLHTLDLIENSKGYYPGNCRWATRLEQTRNRGCTLRFQYRGRNLTVPEWSIELGVPTSTLYTKFNKYSGDGDQIVGSLKHLRVWRPLNSPVFQTYGGRVFYPLSPHPGEIEISDVAHHLSLINRFCGATEKAYCVANHCVLMSRLCDNRLDALGALLHEIAEFAMSDVPGPAKSFLKSYKFYENRILRIASYQFGFEFPLSDRVKELDKYMCAEEAKQLFPSGPNEEVWEPWSKSVGFDVISSEVEVPIEPWPWKRAKREFLKDFEALSSSG